MSITQGAIDFMPLVTDWTYNDIEGWWEWIEEEEKEIIDVVEEDVYKVEDELEIPNYRDADQQDFTSFW